MGRGVSPSRHGSPGGLAPPASTSLRNHHARDRYVERLGDAVADNDVMEQNVVVRAMSERFTLTRRHRRLRAFVVPDALEVGVFGTDVHPRAVKRPFAVRRVRAVRLVSTASSFRNSIFMALFFTL